MARKKRRQHVGYSGVLHDGNKSWAVWHTKDAPSNLPKFPMHDIGGGMLLGSYVYDDGITDFRVRFDDMDYKLLDNGRVSQYMKVPAGQKITGRYDQAIDEAVRLGLERVKSELLEMKNRYVQEYPDRPVDTSRRTGVTWEEVMSS